MLSSSILLLPSFWLSVLAHEQYAPVSAVQQIHKRQLMTCKETYGPKAEVCAGPESTFCFTPSLGQTCCTTDNGYCEKGTYCAPVAGYCCAEGEDLESCARKAGFTLPTSTGSADAGVVAPTGALTVSPFLPAAPPAASTLDIPSSVSSVPSMPTMSNEPSAAGEPSVASEPSAPTDVSVPSNMTAPAPAPAPVPAPSPSSLSNTTVLPFVQVSFAVKKDRVWTGSLGMVGVAGIFAAFF